MALPLRDAEGREHVHPAVASLEGELESMRLARELGLRDYVDKNGFESVVFGLSGGIDSSLVAAIAVDALGSENVLGVSMPSGYSSAGSKSDAQELAENLGIQFLTAVGHPVSASHPTPAAREP